MANHLYLLKNLVNIISKKKEKIVERWRFEHSCHACECLFTWVALLLFMRMCTNSITFSTAIASLIANYSLQNFRHVIFSAEKKKKLLENIFAAMKKKFFSIRDLRNSWKILENLQYAIHSHLYYHSQLILDRLFQKKKQ